MSVITPSIHAQLSQLIGAELTEAAALDAFNRITLSLSAEPGGDSIIAADETAADAVAAVEGVSSADAVAARNRRTIGVIAEAVKLGHMLLTPTNPAWPARLNDLGARRPVLLWARGNLAVLSGDSVCLTGARASSAYGEQMAAHLTAGLAGVTLMNGGAYGIDAATLRVALRNDLPTVVVQASGIDRVYPAAHSELNDRVATNGLIVTEYAPGTAPTRWRFLRRNVVIAALASATVIIEAGARSGSLSVAGNALELGRPVGAVPHSALSSTGEGPHRLIREHGAALVTSSADIMSLAKDGA
ncbi:DNA-processing protein DprA [Leucobacter sp. cx-169]|uniref:DNA-processing protein DprA n=1 Tax=Leucobacter sp. cx-169 TaxID=2770549 RepID=UPI00165DA39E|nr:DNA-processing protein DprA [Leucobacter sp. cx-169]MBC9927249.1 DNA-protecting protein DprA [Leucobacter sp. cx-169]